MRKWILFSIALVFVLFIDQAAKAWVVRNMALEETLEILPGLSPYLQLTRSANTGAAFGILPDSGPLFLILPIVIVAGMLFVMVRHVAARDILLPVALGLVVGGALGNLIDRFQYEHVVDFVHFRLPGVISNVSNFADHAIVIGVVLLIIDSLLRDWRAKRADSPASESPDQAA
jgi:signal peptidase II